MTVLFSTLGCKVNRYETETIRQLFLQKGYTCAAFGEAPDIFVLNSCTVTEESDRKSLKALKSIKKKYPDCITVICGCMPQAFPEKFKNSNIADVVFGNTDHKKIPDLVEEYIKTKTPVLAVEEHFKGEEYSTPPIKTFTGRTRAFMKIEDGCDRFCTYCAIPYSRGRVRSRSLKSIEQEAILLAKAGFKEVVLVGINLSAYGCDTCHNICDAVNIISAVDGINRVRLGSLEPDHITEQMLQALKNNSKFCRQFHLSLQSGCDATLKRMNRHYNTEFYKNLVDKIRQYMPDASVTTDIMVGFSGETEQEFNSSLNFVKSVGFARCHVFSYSLRSNTNAEKLGDDVPKAVKDNRNKIMTAAAKKMQQDFLSNMVGKTHYVLCEQNINGTVCGYTGNYTRVHIKTDLDLNGKILPVKAENMLEDYLVGTIEEGEQLG